MSLNLSKIGQLLRETRESKGLTFDTVSEALLIRKRVIGAIEAGDWENLPHPVYVKGYVTQYATLLNIADRLRCEAPSTEDEPPELGLAGSGEGRDFRQTGVREGERRGRSPLGCAVERHRPIVKGMLRMVRAVLSFHLRVFLALSRTYQRSSIVIAHPYLLRLILPCPPKTGPAAELYSGPKHQVLPARNAR